MKVCSHVSSHKNNNMTSMASQACSGARRSLWRFKFMGNAYETRMVVAEVD